jgi:hypothetical protein
MTDLDQVDMMRKSYDNSGSFVQNSERLTRGKSKYLLSTSKRPRKNVKRRTIQELRPLRAIGEEEEVLTHDSNQYSTNDRDQFRAPKAALVVFLFVCSLGSYQVFTDMNYQDSVSDHVKATKFSTRSINATGLDHDPFQIANTPLTTENGTVVIPKELQNLANVFHEPYDPTISKLFLWHIPRSGSTTIKRIAANCMGLTLASEVGKSEVEVRGAESMLKIVEGSDGIKFANVDMSYPEGIAHANSLHVGSDPRIDLVSSAYLYHAAGVFDSDHKGYMFAMMRHPIDRAISLFYNMRRYPQYAAVIGPVETVEMYARSSLVENNWMTRFLSNTIAGQLRPEHEAIAKEVLRTKCIIGLLSDKTESMRRLEMFFNSKTEQSQRRDDCTGETIVFVYYLFNGNIMAISGTIIHFATTCTEKLLYWDWPGKNKHDPIQEGSEAWQRLYDQNTFDIRLYEYAKQLFVAQSAIFKSTFPK